MKLLKKNIIWIASYPRSGNTWFRVFLTNVLSNSESPVSINSLLGTPSASSRLVFDKYSGLNSSELTQDEVDSLKPDIYRLISSDNENDVFIKVHDAWYRNDKREPIFPTEITKGVIYLLRNPYDVALSYAYHSNTSIEKSIDSLNNSSFGIFKSKSRSHSQLNQKLFSWSDHVNSWCIDSNLPLHVIRYEDLLKNPFHFFSKALKFLNIEVADEIILKAIRNCEFRCLQDQEKEIGFNEKPLTDSLFFRLGRSSELSSLQDNQLYMILRENHHKVMQIFGYI